MIAQYPTAKVPTSTQMMLNAITIHPQRGIRLTTAEVAVSYTHLTLPTIYSV